MKTIHIQELNKTFTDREELFKALKDNEQKIISLKKATVYKSAEKGQFASGSLNASEIKSNYDWMKKGYFYPIVNTTNYRDSHGDVHFPALWNKTIKEQSGRIHYVLDHELKVGSVIAWPDNVGLMLKPIEWSAVGKDYPGTTEALILEVAESDIVNQDAKSVYSAKRSVQGSVRMSYVTIKLGINSDSKEYLENKSYYNSRINEIANRQEVEDAGYFFGIEEAKLIKESSMVLFGSNDATSIVYPVAVDDTKGDNNTPPLPSMDYEKLLKAKLFTT